MSWPRFVRRQDPNIVSYAQLADLDTATDKARRDAPALGVCDRALTRHRPPRDSSPDE